VNRLITFEGVDGCGKSMKLNFATQNLRACDEQVVFILEVKMNLI